MNRQEHITKQVDETLESLDGIRRATPAPFLFTRLEARLEELPVSVWDRAIQFITRPVVAIAAILVIVSLNTFAFVEFKQDDSGMARQVKFLADDYAAASSTIPEIAE